MKKVIIGIISLLVLFAGIALYYGAFDSVVITKTNTGPYYMVARAAVGDYRNSGDIMDEVYYSLLNENGLETFRGAGIYFDNPQQVEASACRSLVGCLIDDQDLEQLKLPMDTRLVKISPAERITTSTTYRGMPSVIIALMRVYPALNSWMAEHNDQGGPIMEVYDVPADRMVFVVLSTADVQFEEKK